MKKCDSRHADLKPLRRATSPSGAVVPERSRFATASRSSSRTSRIDLPWTEANLARASEGETPRCLTTSPAVIPEATYAEGFKLCRAYLKGTTRRLLP